MLAGSPVAFVSESWDTPAAPWKETAGVCLMLAAFAMTNTLFNGLLIQRLAPHQQSKYQAPVQMLAAVGRGVGPFLGTSLMVLGDSIKEGIGPRLMLVMCFCSVAASIAVPAAWGPAFMNPVIVAKVDATPERPAGAVKLEGAPAAEESKVLL